jgi:hypothetical protein
MLDELGNVMMVSSNKALKRLNYGHIEKDREGQSTREIFRSFFLRQPFSLHEPNFLTRSELGLVCGLIWIRQVI